MSSTPFDDAAPDAPILVAVVNDPEDLRRAQAQGWYRIPLAHAPNRIGADFLAFYLTGAFPPDERWAVRWIAPIRGYHLATRLELIPEEPEHPRAHDRYYRVELGELAPLPHPVPSRRLRRITFIRTTLERLMAAREINELWLRTPAQERLWRALQEAGLADEVEHEYPPLDDFPLTADFALFGERERIAVFFDDSEVSPGGHIRERAGLDYPLARGGWRVVYVDTANQDSLARCLVIVFSLHEAIITKSE